MVFIELQLPMQSVMVHITTNVVSSNTADWRDVLDITLCDKIWLKCCDQTAVGFRFMMFNATFNNISAISWRSVLLVKETGVPGENQNIKEFPGRHLFFC
jgi:hypothetical protein